MKLHIFTSLKVVRDGDLEQVSSDKHNNINRIEFRPAVQYAYLMRFFYCEKYDCICRNSYLVFENTHARIYNNGMKRNYTPIELLAPVTQVCITNTGSIPDLFLPLDRGEAISNRRLRINNSLMPFWREGMRLVFSLTQQFHFPLTGC